MSLGKHLTPLSLGVLTCKMAATSLPPQDCFRNKTAQQVLVCLLTNGGVLTPTPSGARGDKRWGRPQSKIKPQQQEAGSHTWSTSFHSAVLRV